MISTLSDDHFVADGLDGSRVMPRTFHPGSFWNTRATEPPYSVLLSHAAVERLFHVRCAYLVSSDSNDGD